MQNALLRELILVVKCFSSYYKFVVKCFSYDDDDDDDDFCEQTYCFQNKLPYLLYYSRCGITISTSLKRRDY